jgi:hypothetical protein
MDAGQEDHEVDPGRRDGPCSREGVDVEPGLEEESTSGYEAAVDVSGSIEAEVADLAESRGQGVQEEASDELLWLEGDPVDTAGTEGDASVVVGDESLVRDGDAAEVAAEVSEDMPRFAFGRLEVDDPLLVPEPPHQAGESEGVFEVAGRAAEPQVAEVVGGANRREDQSAEQGSHPGGWEEVVALWLNPPRAVESEATGRDDTVEVGVVVELSGPGVQDDGGAELRAEHVGGEGVQCTSGRIEEQVVYGLLIAQGDGSELLWQGEDDMEVADGQDALGAFGEPSSAGEGLAGGAMAVAAGVIHRLLVAAVRADVEMATAPRGTAGLEVVEQASLLRRQGVVRPVSSPVVSEDIDETQRTAEAGCTAPVAGVRRPAGAASHRRPLCRRRRPPEALVE